jgi:putative endonuclease
MPFDMTSSTGQVRSNQKQMYFVYVLFCKDKKLYTGSTIDLKNRYSEHLEGRVISTKHRRPLFLIHYEVYKLKSDALRREMFLKTTEGKRLLRQQIRDLLTQLHYLET